MERTRIKSIIHSVLFASEKPVTQQKLTEIFENELDEVSIAGILEEMKKEMDSCESCGTKMEHVANGWQIRTKEENTNWIKKLENIRPIRISVSALETLAIIAYKQPIHKAEIDKIRGVDSSHLVRTLLEKNLVRISGRSVLPGKPLLYSTTPEFLEVFGLANIKDLPSLAEFGDTGDFKEGLNQYVEITDDVNDGVNIKEMDHTLDRMTELGRELRVDIDLVQEKVDVVFNDACRKYASQRQEIFGEQTTQD